MKSAPIAFYFPKYLIDSIDNYLNNNTLETSRSALLKLCITLHISDMTPQKEARAIILQDSSIRRSQGKMFCTPLRCKKPIKPSTSAIRNVCRALVYLDLDQELLKFPVQV